jgi:hypothetical protein
MSLDITKLEHVRARGEKITSRCPACAETGHDQTRNHLIIQTNGRFGCVIYPGDSPDARAHRKRIFALCGSREIKPLSVRPAGLGRLGRTTESHPANAPLKSGLLGRLGRLFQTHSGTEVTHAGNKDRTTEKLNDFKPGVPGVLSTPAVEPHRPRSEREWARKWHLLTMLTSWPLVIAYSQTLGETIFFCQDEATKAALQNAGTAEWSIYTRDELRILCEQNRIAPISATELQTFHQIKRTFNARIAPNGPPSC